MDLKKDRKLHDDVSSIIINAICTVHPHFIKAVMTFCHNDVVEHRT